MLLHCAVAAACAASAVAAHAGRPLVTEDADVLEPRACEFEGYAARSRAPTARGAFVQLSCGVGWHSEAAVALSRTRSDGDDTRATGVLGKTRLNEPADDAPAYTLAWQLGADDASGAWRAEVAALTAVLSAPLANGLMLHANLGWSRLRSVRQSSTGWALALEHVGKRGIDVMAEAFANDRDKRPWLQVAARWALLPERLYFDGSWGVQAAHGRPKAVTLGVMLAF